jgi:hypothetical protein
MYSCSGSPDRLSNLHDHLAPPTASSLVVASANGAITDLASALFRREANVNVRAL